jgi:phosphatidylglycerol lysyltransferase
VIAYGVIGRTAIALGDPIGPVDDAPAAIREFIDVCHKNDWRLGFYQVRPDYLRHYADAGYQPLCIGHDAIVNLKEFTTSGGSNKQIRWSYNRFTKLGYHVEVLHPPHSETLISKLREVSDDWLISMNSAEKRFSLGSFDDSYLQMCRVMVVIDPDLRVSAFANILPEYGDRETTIDLMRRRRDAEPGTMEFLFVGLLEWARDQGFKAFNLGLSPLSGVGDAPKDPAVERVLNYVYEHLNQFYSFKGLHTFKSKFKPYWEPRYLIHPAHSSLPQIGLAIVHANSGGTYLQSVLSAIIGNMQSKRKRAGAATAVEPEAQSGDPR